MVIDFQPPPHATEQVQPASNASFDEQYEQARGLANNGQPALAVAAYNALLMRSPGNVDVLLGRGIAYTRLERWAEAQADLEAAAKASPDYADVWLALGNLHRWHDQPEPAIAAYSRLVALRPDDAAAWLARARAWRAAGKLPEARADLARARTAGGNAAEIDAFDAALTPAADPAPDTAAIAAISPQPRAGNPEAALAAGYAWAASLSGNWTDVGPGPRWNDQTASLRHYTKRGSIGFETLRAHRFDQSGYAWALDAYADLWNGAYANLRYQRAPAARLFPENAGRIEVWQSLGGGWEASLSDDVLGFDSRVNIYGASLARYVGNWYIQLRHQNIVSESSHGSGDRLLARYYYAGDADSYIEATANRGRSDDPLSLAGGRARSGGGSLTWVRYWSRDWGSKVGASFSHDSGDGSGARERGVSFGLYRRW
ncbi:YaiO family outer membrane beta-barrel protein [Massilia brevitalea]|uniref:YaiO family outer membrane beta-barrel protein n=1 Tax=Massilia brevitalea TaxID=442526 RepID=UPI002738F272|nr:YaiO family outer membrane beta-barrel protein [Massilia brevitalea]